MPIRILHITKDDKFFDRLITLFESDQRLVNKSVVINETKKPFKYITLIDKARSVTVSELKHLLKQGNYDVVYYHSIPETIWRSISWIPKSKKIIWWSWGYDLYRSRLPYFRPLFTLDLYKAQTKRYIDEHDANNHNNGNIYRRIIAIVKAHYLEHCRRKALSRIDYYIPVIPQEYDMLVNNYGFKAHLFSDPTSNRKYDFILPQKNVAPGSILLGNSASISNNHLDVWSAIKNTKIIKRTIILPVNYGDIVYRNYLKDHICSVHNEIVFLEDYLPFDEYNRILDKCRFALFGIIRQQALGNVILCIQRGIKLFFFEDSMVYRYLKEMGCFVYTIEKMNEYEISTPLSEKEAEHNYIVWSKYRSKCYQLYNSVINRLTEEI